MSLESLLERLHGEAVTPVTPGHAAVSREKPLQNRHVPPVTLVTPKRSESKSELAPADLPPEDASRPRWRISVVGPQGLSVEFDWCSAWTVSDWGAWARSHYGEDATVIVRAAPAMECPSLPGVSPEFAARLDAEDLADVADGDIPVEQVQAFETVAVAREREALRECFLERVAILAETGVAEAELEAARLTAVFARNARFLWVSLRSAFEGRPELLAQLPEGRGQVDALPLGMATVAVRRDGGAAAGGVRERA